ncbi:RNA polymerase sigma factor [Paenibacillus antarcticus]|uniref:RNA polymerase subunit sigma-70 n=1 Tax=Paenibacillus antarcticus TaxID=253703 RepID=A0A168PQG3_9BACL|nr:RNA polymerase sigma factor [Paenibacillus antarcticus]OAB46974.1 RNA polymerase subunit sigma-70 [Paenibacillus antarcticus]
MNDHELFETYKEQVYRLCYYMMQNRSDAEDMCQEVFVKAILTDRSQVREIKAWLLRIASNECSSVLRRRKHGWTKEMSAYLRSRPLSSNPVEDSYDQRETKVEFYKLYRMLPDKVRMVFTLRYVNELTVPEISKVINVPEGTVKSRLNRGLKLLQNKAASQVKEMVGNESTL